MKKIILGSLMAMTLFSGCNAKYGEVKKAFGEIKYERCQKLVNSVSDDRSMDKNSIMLVAILVSQCENTESILAEIKIIKESK